MRILFPESCVLCNKNDIALCEECIVSLPAFPHAPHPFIYPLFSYHDKRVHKVVHALKYNHTRSITNILSLPMHDILQDVLKESLELHRTITLLPVPSMQSHVNKRGGNHVQMLAEQIAKHNHSLSVVYDAIIRVNTKAQRTLTRCERLVNMKNAFKVIDETKIRGANIIIVDDVCTTGATIQELRATCLKASARNVIALAIAH